MNKDFVFAVLKKSILEILPIELTESEIALAGSLRSLGANSIDRAEIIMRTMEELGVRGALAEFANAKNMGELCDVFLMKASKPS